MKRRDFLKAAATLPIVAAIISILPKPKTAPSIIVDPYLTDNEAWYVFDLKNHFKPVSSPLCDGKIVYYDGSKETSSLFSGDL